MHALLRTLGWGGSQMNLEAPMFVDQTHSIKLYDL